MPVFEITYPQGALEPDARAKLMDDLTTTLLHAERAPDTGFFRDVTWGYVHELPADAVIASGRPVKAPTFKIDVTTPEGALSDRRREEYVAEATRLVARRPGSRRRRGCACSSSCTRSPRGAGARRAR